jgi:secreted Zn-dependent insulinase-like peptidase
VLNSILTSISIKYLEHYLYTELNNIFSLNYDINIIENTLYNNIIINYTCPNDITFYKKFIDKTLELIKNIKEKDIVNEIILSLINKHIEIYQNINMYNPWEFVNYYFNNITIENNYTIEENINALKKINTKDIINHIKELFNNNDVTTIHYGNLHINDIYKNNNIISSNITYKIPKFTFPDSKNISINHPNPAEKNNCVAIYHYIGFFTPIKFLCTTIINNIVKDEFFNVLRTQKQLGYLVNFSLSKTRFDYYFVEKIQSNKTCDIILKEILDFNEKIISYIEKCDIDEEKLVAKNYLEEKENNLNDYYSKYSSEIILKEYMFDRSKLVLKQLDNITKQLLIDTVNNYILNNNNMCIINIMGNT